MKAFRTLLKGVWTAVLLSTLAFGLTSCEEWMDYLTTNLIGRWYAEQNLPGTIEVDGTTIEYQKIALFGQFQQKDRGYWATVFVDETGHAIDIPGYSSSGTFNYAVTLGSIHITMARSSVPILHDSWDLTIKNGGLYFDPSTGIKSPMMPITPEQHDNMQQWLEELGFGGEDEQPIAFNLTANYPKAIPGTVKVGWYPGDVIFVFFSGQAAPAYLEMKMEDNQWAFTPKNSLTFSEGETGTMTAVYLPFGSGATVENEGDNYKFNPTYYSDYLTATMNYKVADGMVSGTFDMQIPDGYIQFFVTDTDADASIACELREPHLTPQGIASIAADGTIIHTKIAHGAPLTGYVFDSPFPTDSKGWLFSGILSDDARNDKGEEHKITYHFTLVRNGWNGDYYYEEYKDQLFYLGDQEGRAMNLSLLFNNANLLLNNKPIDMGCDVPTGVEDEVRRIYWSSRNLGASRDHPNGWDTGDISIKDAEEQLKDSFGHYYAWGETQTKKTYSWGTYTFDNSESHDGSSFSKYNGSDYSVLQITDDVARTELGGIWRMPTKAEWEALSNPDNYSYNENMGYAMGYFVKSKLDGYNDGRFLFLPYAGYWDEKGLSAYSFGGGVYIWSSSIENQPSHACYASDGAWGGQIIPEGGFPRYVGLPVRPITE